MDVARFKSTYMNTYQKLYYVAYRLLENESDAQDLVQETYTKIWSKRNELESVGNKEAYVMMMLRNLCLDHLRRKSIRPIQPINEIDYRLESEEESSQMRLENEEELCKVERAILTLPQQQQQVIRLRHWNDLSIEEIEKVTGLTSINVRVLLSRGRKRIKEILSIRYR